MSTIEPKKNNFSNLRKVAEEKLNPLGKKIIKAPHTGVPQTMDELERQKHELEVQNEKLLATQTTLLKSIEEYSEIFEYSPMGYFILDKEGVIIKANETGSKLLNINKKQLRGKYLSVFLNSKSCQDDFYKYRTMVVESKIKQQFECKIKRQDGSVFFAMIEGLQVKDEDNQFKFMFFTISDISKQKLQERALQLALKKEKELNKMKSQFITIASHEFRTPLATILTSAELMERYNSLDQEKNRKKHYHKIKSSITRLEEILKDFLSTNDIEKGKILNNPELFSLVKFTKKIIDETKSANSLYSVKYKHIGDYESVHLDMKLLRTCITNLIINAYKYSSEGGLIEIATVQNIAGEISLIVKDNGIGIPEEEQEHIFKMFYRAKNAEAIQGTGLGLNITHELVTIMGGGISFISKVNEGSTFTMKFPKNKLGT